MLRSRWKRPALALLLVVVGALIVWLSTDVYGSDPFLASLLQYFGLACTLAGIVLEALAVRARR